MINVKILKSYDPYYELAKEFADFNAVWRWSVDHSQKHNNRYTYRVTQLPPGSLHDYVVFICSDDTPASYWHSYDGLVAHLA